MGSDPPGRQAWHSRCTQGWPLLLARRCVRRPPGGRAPRSEERRVGKEGRSRGLPYHYKKIHSVGGHGSAMRGSPLVRCRVPASSLRFSFDPAVDRLASECGLIFYSSRRRHPSCLSDWSSDVCSSDLLRLIRANSGTVPVLSKPGYRLHLGRKMETRHRFCDLSPYLPDQDQPRYHLHLGRKMETRLSRVSRSRRRS